VKVIALIEDEKVIAKILKHPGLWDLKIEPTPKVKFPSVTISIDNSDFQVSFSAHPSIRTRVTRWIRTGFQNGMGWLRGLLLLL